MHQERGRAIVVSPPSALAAAMRVLRSAPADAAAVGAAVAADGAAVAVAAGLLVAAGELLADDEQAATLKAARTPTEARRNRERLVINLPSSVFATARRIGRVRLAWVARNAGYRLMAGAIPAQGH